MSEETNPLGNIEIAPAAIATIASQAVLHSYGVVGMAAKNVVDGLTNRLTRDPRHGIDDVAAALLHIVVGADRNGLEILLRTDDMFHRVAEFFGQPTVRHKH